VALVHIPTRDQYLRRAFEFSDIDEKTAFLKTSKDSLTLESENHRIGAWQHIEFQRREQPALSLRF
jgi:hypothetical protein